MEFREKFFLQTEQGSKYQTKIISLTAIVFQSIACVEDILVASPFNRYSSSGTTIEITDLELEYVFQDVLL